MKIFFILLSNGSCVRSEKSEIVPNIKTNRVSVRWTNEEGN
jgi:hypothetical protein